MQVENSQLLPQSTATQLCQGRLRYLQANGVVPSHLINSQASNSVPQLIIFVDKL